MTIRHVSCSLRVKALGGDGVFSGYASVFGEIDQQNEVVAAGAFGRTLAFLRRMGRMPAMLWMHDPTQPIGIWQTIREDANGLSVEGRLALRTQRGDEAYELLKMGALTGLSIGYRVVASQIDAKRKVRILTDLDLFEISLVTFPANEAARVSEVKAPAAANSTAKPARTVPNPRDEMRAIVARLHQAARKLGEK
jgi:HK97 family phage prohead protease